MQKDVEKRNQPFPDGEDPSLVRHTCQPSIMSYSKRFEVQQSGTTKRKSKLKYSTKISRVNLVPLHLKAYFMNKNIAYTYVDSITQLQPNIALIYEHINCYLQLVYTII